MNQAIEDTPELTQLLRLIPIVGNRIEQQIQSIGQRLGENITQGIIQPFATIQSGETLPSYRYIAKQISQIPLEKNTNIDRLVSSAVFESLDAIQQQVKIKHWQQIMEESKNEAKQNKE